jgi:serine/threonine-protein kinase HipA
MTDTIEVHIDFDGQTRPVGLCRYIAKRNSRSSVFEYKDEWSKAEHAFAIDPENLPLRAGLFSRQSNQSALPGAIRDTAPDRWLMISIRFRSKKRCAS